MPVEIKIKQPGYIALISVLIISAMLVVMATGISATSFFLRFNILDSEYKQRSSFLAEGCQNVVLFNLSKDINYTSTDNINIGSDSCKIFLVQHNFPSAGQITIQTKAVVQNAATNLQIVVDTNLNLISREELPSL